jgi:hypothetical protein
MDAYAPGRWRHGHRSSRSAERRNGHGRCDKEPETLRREGRWCSFPARSKAAPLDQRLVGSWAHELTDLRVCRRQGDKRRPSLSSPAVEAAKVLDGGARLHGDPTPLSSPRASPSGSCVPPSLGRMTPSSACTDWIRRRHEGSLGGVRSACHRLAAGEGRPQSRKGGEAGGGGGLKQEGQLQQHHRRQGLFVNFVGDCRIDFSFLVRTS